MGCSYSRGMHGGLSDLGGVCISPYVHIPSVCLNTPRHLYASMLPLHLYVSRGHLYTIWGWGHLYTHTFGVWGHPLSLSNNHAHCFPSVWVASLLNWMLMDVCYASCCCTFLSSFIMSQASNTMAIITTPLVTVVSSGQGCLNAWACWKITWGPHEHRGPMLIYVCCDLLSINK